MSFLPDDLPGTLRRCRNSVGVACDWIEERDLDEATALLGYVLDDLERLLAAPTTSASPTAQAGLIEARAKDNYCAQVYQPPNAATVV